MYRIADDDLHFAGKLSDEDRLAVSWFTKRSFLRHMEPAGVALDPADWQPTGYVRLPDIRAMRPANITDLHDDLLLTIASMGDYGDEHVFEAVDSPIALAANFKGLVFHIRQLRYGSRADRLAVRAAQSGRP